MSTVTTKATSVYQEAPLTLLGPWSRGKGQLSSVIWNIFDKFPPLLGDALDGNSCDKDTSSTPAQPSSSGLSLGTEVLLCYLLAPRGSPVASALTQLPPKVSSPPLLPQPLLPPSGTAPPASEPTPVWATTHSFSHSSLVVLVEILPCGIFAFRPFLSPSMDSGFISTNSLTSTQINGRRLAHSIFKFSCTVTTSASAQTNDPQIFDS